MTKLSIKERMIEFVKKSQFTICESLSQLNESSFKSNPWIALEGSGGGIACIFPKGKVFEKGGVNISNISGKVFPGMMKMLDVDSNKDPTHLNFFATGISIVLHPYSPMVPTVHANFRYFEIDEDSKPLTWFFGGGSDLTPYYLFEEDAMHFHQTLKDACDRHDPHFYPTMKKEADNYFYLPHRKEHRGVGGIFVLRIKDREAEKLLEWAKDGVSAFLPSYLPILERRKKIPFGPNEKEWQHVRRGRYVEFNLMYDVGTSFGLKLAGSLFGTNIQNNVENILMSLPPNVCWEYNYIPKKGSQEEKLIEVIKHPKEWL